MKTTVPLLLKKKSRGEKFAVLTAYDYPGAKLADAAGVDVILVGDSLANVVQGKATTLSVSLQEMIYHGEMVVRAAENALVVVDIPFPYAQQGPREAVKAATRILKKTLADAVKIEGGKSRCETIRAVVQAGVPVMGHCGLQPQEIKKLGSFSIQKDSEKLLADVQAVQQAGAFAVVLECISPELAQKATETLAIPTIGIGAGPHCDGQVLVFHDMLGFEEKPPKHVKKVYADLGKTILEAVKSYCEEVREGKFP